MRLPAKPCAHEHLQDLVHARTGPPVVRGMKLLSIVTALALFACIPPQQQGSSPSYYTPAPAPQGGGYVQGNATATATATDEDDDGARADEPQAPQRNDMQARAAAVRRSIQINGAYLTPERARTLARLEATYHGSLPNGAYWYDPVNGAAGVWGQPGAAILPAGLDLGPPLPANASNGTSGVYINNRQLQNVEVQFLSALVGVPWQRGRYFIDALGNAGLEGGAVLVNLVQVAQQRSRTAAGGSRVDDRGDYSRTFGFGPEHQSHFFSSADGKCKSFSSPKGTVFVGC